jgi:hydrogenase maturation protein HypF
VILLEKTANSLRQQGLLVLSSRQVPPGDSGLALGQTWLALRHLEQSPELQYDVMGRGND